MLLRSQIVKQQMADIENMKLKIEAKDEDIKELRRQLMLKVS